VRITASEIEEVIKTPGGIAITVQYTNDYV
jgi:hypothetical protein